tara:strand:- start:9659 stop:9820 length:162 start_codon:yes stop_codon:yes gene_type:complete
MAPQPLPKAVIETDEQYNTRVLENVIAFLEENQQYGDDWESEIKVLRSLQRKS